jgi:large subunit ribosomal protein L10
MSGFAMMPLPVSGRGFNSISTHLKLRPEEVEKSMSNIKAEKEKVVNEIKEKLERAASFVLVDYRGLNVQEVTELRKKAREVGVEYKVYKNTMMTRAMKELGMEGFEDYLEGPNAIALGYDDPVVTAKVIADFAKGHEKLEIKVGMLENRIIGLDQVKALADLPAKEVLVAQVLGTLNAPITGFANVLQGNIRKLVYALDAIREKQTA